MITIKYPNLTYREYMAEKTKLEKRLKDLRWDGREDTVGAEMIRMKLQALKDSHPVERMLDTNEQFQKAKDIADQFIS